MLVDSIHSETPLHEYAHYTRDRIRLATAITEFRSRNMAILGRSSALSGYIPFSTLSPVAIERATDRRP
jgi:hypothetical protein